MRYYLQRVVSIPHMPPYLARAYTLVAPSMLPSLLPRLPAASHTGRLILMASTAICVFPLFSQVEILAVGVELLPCAVGEALEPSSSSQGALASWTSCQPCGQEQLGLWRDTRPRLSAVRSNSSSSNSGSLEDVQSDMAMIVEQLLDRANSKRAAVCRTCPPMAQCPGGAVVVPLPGWWHSAANSTAMHRCPYAPACGRGAKEEQVSVWTQRQQYYEIHAQANANASTVATAQDSIPFGSDARSAALAWCQAEWYASSWLPGAAVVAAAVSDRLLPEGLDTAGISDVVGLPSGINMPALSPSTNSTAAAAPPCLLWYDAALTPGLDPAAFDVLSYTQLQCAVSYTGNLCAACEPGYYGGARFQCADCATVLRTACLGLLAFLGSFIVVLVTAYATLLVDYTAFATERVAGSAELLKVRERWAGVRECAGGYGSCSAPHSLPGPDRTPLPVSLFLCGSCAASRRLQVYSTR